MGKLLGLKLMSRSRKLGVGSNYRRSSGTLMSLPRTSDRDFNNFARNLVDPKPHSRVDLHQQLRLNFLPNDGVG